MFNTYEIKNPIKLTSYISIELTILKIALFWWLVYLSIHLFLSLSVYIFPVPTLHYSFIGALFDCHFFCQLRLFITVCPFYSNWNLFLIALSVLFVADWMDGMVWKIKNTPNCSNFQFEHIIWNLHVVNYFFFDSDWYFFLSSFHSNILYCCRECITPLFCSGFQLNLFAFYVFAFDFSSLQWLIYELRHCHKLNCTNWIKRLLRLNHIEPTIMLVWSSFEHSSNDKKVEFCWIFFVFG